jgi:hypothetical protein
VYHPDVGEFTVPSQIYNVIGSGQVSSTVTSSVQANSFKDQQVPPALLQPSDGCSNEAVATFFNQPGAVAKGTTVSSGTHSGGGKIAGIVAGSCVGAALIVACIALLVIRRKRKQKSRPSTEGQEEQETNIHEAPEEDMPHRFAWARLRNPRLRPSCLFPARSNYLLRLRP